MGAVSTQQRERARERMTRGPLTQEERERHAAITASWATALNVERLVHDLRHVAEDVRYFDATTRTAVLNEAANRLETFARVESLQRALEAERDRMRAEHDDEHDDEFSMGAVVEAVERLGLHAIVEHTGGGVATIYVEPLLDDGTGDERYAACAGPGWFDTVNGPTASRAEFYVGPDDGGESKATCITSESVEQIAQMLVAVARTSVSAS